MAVDRSSVLLGSGELYLVAYSGTLPADDATFEAEANSVGRIQGGASLEYKPTEYEVVDDAGEVVKRFVTKEEVSFKSGVLTWDMGNLAKLSPATLVDDPTTTHTRTLTIGGASSLDSYALRFVHTKDDGNKLRVTLIATAGNGFTLSFAGDKETVVDAEFKALSQTDGTLVEVKEQMPTEWTG